MGYFPRVPEGGWALLPYSRQRVLAPHERREGAQALVARPRVPIIGAPPPPPGHGPKRNSAPRCPMYQGSSPRGLPAHDDQRPKRRVHANTSNTRERPTSPARGRGGRHHLHLQRASPHRQARCPGGTPPPPSPRGLGTDPPRDVKKAESSLPAVFSSMSRALSASRLLAAPPPLVARTPPSHRRRLQGGANFSSSSSSSSSLAAVPATPRQLNQPRVPQHRGASRLAEPVPPPRGGLRIEEGSQVGSMGWGEHARDLASTSSSLSAAALHGWGAPRGGGGL